ncbi:MAG: transglutaminase domain-containing protein, partial [Thermoleophilia bacterium]
MRSPRRLLVFLALSWVLVVLYPDPTLLVRSLRNTLRPRVDAAAVSGLAARLPDDPQAIDAWVLQRGVPYAYDWQTVGVPWYFPTTAEALAAGRGDCEGRAMVLASILAAKGIPHELRMSLGHIWVDYPGKRANDLENPAVELAGRRDGRFFLHWPRAFDLRSEVAEQLTIHWTPAPAGRRLLLAGGLTFIGLWNPLAVLL